MDLMKNYSEYDPVNKVASPTNRRSFLRTFIGGIAIAVPALSVLGAPPAAASSVVVPDVNPCTKWRPVLLGTSCNGVRGCPVGSGFECVSEWERISTINGQSCGVFTENEGPCSNACHAISSAAC